MQTICACLKLNNWSFSVGNVGSFATQCFGSIFPAIFSRKTRNKSEFTDGQGNVMRQVLWFVLMVKRWYFSQQLLIWLFCRLWDELWVTSAVRAIELRLFLENFVLKMCLGMCSVGEVAVPKWPWILQHRCRYLLDCSSVIVREFAVVVHVAVFVCWLVTWMFVWLQFLQFPVLSALPILCSFFPTFTALKVHYCDMLWLIIFHVGEPTCLFSSVTNTVQFGSLVVKKERWRYFVSWPMWCLGW